MNLTDEDVQRIAKAVIEELKIQIDAGLGKLARGVEMVENEENFDDEGGGATGC